MRASRAETNAPGQRLSTGALLWWLAVIVAIPFALRAVASALTPLLAARHPLLLLALDARATNLLLTRHVGYAPALLPRRQTMSPTRRDTRRTRAGHHGLGCHAPRCPA
jgi:hypothetical protein